MEPTMSRIEVDQVLAQIRALRPQVPSASGSVAAAPAASASPSFAAVLKQGIDAVNALQKDAGAAAVAFEKGVAGVELADVMIQMQKASVGFRATVEVRNRLVNAYQEIMSMPV
jgi:flagellar hook-basal body complex protein FliE